MSNSALAINELKQVITKVVPLIVGKGMAVTQRGANAYVDLDPVTKRPRAVNIPNLSENASLEFIKSVGGFVDHECAHILFTDFDIYCGSITKGASEKSMLAQLHNIVEDTMIERRMEEDFPGSKRNLSEMRISYLNKITGKALKSSKSEMESFRYLIVPLMRAMAGHGEMVDFMDAGKHWENSYVKELVVNLSENSKKLLKKATTTAETLIVAEELVSLLKMEEPEQSEGEGEGEGTPSQGSSKGEKSESKSGSSEGTPSEGEGEKSEGEDKGSSGKGGKKGSNEPSEDEEDGSDKSEDGEGSGDEKEGEGSSGKGDDGEDEGGESSSGDEGEGDDSEGDDGKDGDDDTKDPTSGESSLAEFGDHDNDESSEGDGVGSGAVTKSIFDFEEDFFDGVDVAETLVNEIHKEAVEMMHLSDYNVYTTEFDRIEPLKVPASFTAKAAAIISSMEEETMIMTGRMQKDIERMLASRSYAIRTPGYKRGKLHTASLHRVMQGDSRVFTQKQEKVTTETAVSLVVDNSGSMRGDKMKTAMMASFALARTLDRVGIKHEIIGFTTAGFGSHNIPHEIMEAMYEEVRASKIKYDRDCPLAMPIYKSFDDRLDVTVKSRIAYAMSAQQGLAGNIDGESIRIAANRLHTRREKRKVMIVLSDGQPAGSYRSGEHLRATVNQLKVEGIETVGIGIMDASVSAYYDNHVVLRNLLDLPGQVMNELKKILI